MSSPDYAHVERAIRYLDRNARSQPGLKDVARHLGMSEYHVQRLFTRWAGISPKRFLQFLTASHASRLLREERSTLDVALEVGLSGQGRLHDLIVNVEGVTPGEMKRRGAGLTIAWGVHATPFGECLLALATRGVCALAFIAVGDQQGAVAGLAARWPAARFREERERTAEAVARAFARAPAEPPPPLFLRGTNFQLKVWKALLAIPPGQTTTYGDLGRAIAAPSAARAVGNAVGQNPVAFLIPCHRVIRSTGAFGGYRWGPDRKAAILAWESLRTSDSA